MHNSNIQIYINFAFEITFHQHVNDVFDNVHCCEYDQDREEERAYRVCYLPLRLKSDIYACIQYKQVNIYELRICKINLATTVSLYT